MKFTIIMLLLAVVTIVYLINEFSKEKFAPAYYYDYYYPDYYNTYTNFPFWNTQYGTTRNMSYDLRGDYYIPKMWTPFNMSSYIPIINRPL